MQPLHGHIFQIFLWRFAPGNRVVGQIVGAKRDLHIAAHGDFQRVGQSLGNIGKHSRHFIRTAQVLLRAVPPWPTRVVQRTTFVNTHSSFVGLKIFGVQKTNIVGGHHTEVQLLGHLHSPANKQLFIGSVCAGQFQIIAIGKNLSPPLQGCQRRLLIAVTYAVPQMPTDPTG